MLADVNENLSCDPLIQLNGRNLGKASLFHIEDSRKCSKPKFQLSGTSRNCATFPYNKTEHAH